VSVRGGRVFINGERQVEGYIRPDDECGICNLPTPITIPSGHLFVMGDNRGESADSREWGPVPTDAVIGKVQLRYWPPGSFGVP